MSAKQLSVFIENRQGRLGEVLSVLKEGGVNILSLSLADTSEYGLLRLIVSDPENGRKILAEKGFSTMLTEVYVVKIGHKAGSLCDLVKGLSDVNINVEYMYGLSTAGADAYIVLKLSDTVKAEKVLNNLKISTLSDKDIASIA
ncbi:MAG: amino acid-binding protein [Clostridia bacterium]|nr:amino acid-binding protein [Clostridia bacterium]